MIEVIKYGLIKPKKAVCPHCKAILSYNVIDFDQSLVENVLTCPVCNTEINIS